MIVILDTDHATALQVSSGPRRERLRARMAAMPDQLYTIAAVTIEEQLRGWIAAQSDMILQVGAYHRLVDLVRFFSAWQIAPFDDGAARASFSLKKQRLRIGTMDLKIAATALSNDALLLTANRKDFGLVPGLRFENSLD